MRSESYSINSIGSLRLPSLPNDQFFIENNEAIERLISERSNFIERLNTRVAQLKVLVCEDADIRSLLSQDPWIYIRSVLVMDFAILEGRKPIALDLGISTGGWELTIFGRSGGEPYLAQLIEQCPRLQELRSSERTPQGRRIVKKWDLDTKIEEIHAFLAQFIRKVDEAMRAREEAPSPRIQS